MTITKTTTGRVYLTAVDQWLDSLPASESEDFKEFAEVTPSVIEIWVYAGIMVLKSRDYFRKFCICKILLICM